MTPLPTTRWPVAASALMLATACATLLVPPLARAQAQASADPAASSASAPTTAGALPAGAVEVDNPEKLKGLKRVVIPAFNVHFLTESRADVQINGVQVITGAPSNVKVTLKGADPARFQAIADALYDRTVQQLQAAGIEVVPIDQLKAHPSYAELAQRGDTGPKEEDASAGKGTFVTARGLPLIHMDEVSFIQKFEIKLFGGKKPEDTFLPLSTKLSSGFTAGFVAQAESKLAKELDAALLKVRITVLGGTLDVGHSFWTGKEISTKAAASLPPLVNRYAFILPNGDRARISLKQAATSAELGEMVNVTSAGSQAADVARNVLNVALILGGARTSVGYGRSADYEWRVEPALYERVIDAQTATVAEAFSQRLKQAVQ